MNSEEYLSKITEPISVGRFLMIVENMAEYLWYRGAECTACAQTCAYIQTYEGNLYIIKLDVDEDGKAYGVNFFENEMSVDEIPDKVANDSLRVLFPTISPITIGVVVGAILIAGLWVTKKLKF